MTMTKPRIIAGRPIIGSRYHGPAMDRPALRRMPSHWRLEGAQRSPAWWRVWRIAERLLLVAICIVLYLSVLSVIGGVTQ